MSYDRKLKYLELWENGNRMHSAGFVKLEARDGKVCMQLKVDKLKSADDGNKKITLVGGEKENLLGNIVLQQGRGEASFEEMGRMNMVNGVGYEDVQEVIVELSEDRILRCMIENQNEAKKKREEPLVEESVTMKEPDGEPVIKLVPESILEPALEQEDIPIPILQAQLQPEEESPEPKPEEKVIETPSANKWQQLWNTYPHIKPFDDQREYLELKPEDLVVLANACYPLVSNSFLLHGFYNYKHLILTKEHVRGQEQYYIGAPGNFYAKEKQVAVLFGFESFEGKAEPAQNGDFGYYMIPVEI